MPNTPDSNASGSRRGFLEASALVFGRYRLKKLIGRGGMGVVWQATDTLLDSNVALKFVPEALANDDSAMEALRQETRLCLKLTHPGIVRVYDFISSDGLVAIVMEFVDGMTLDSLRKAHSPKVFEFWQIEPWIAEICSALEYAHETAKVVHRDLKPSNFMVTADNRIKIMDFGISRSLQEAGNRATSMLATFSGGTLGYMSPQQLMGRQASVADDIYSLGATLCELLTGKPPFYSGDISTQIRELEPARLSERRKEFGIDGEVIPRPVELAVADCLSKDPNHRPSSIREFAESVLRPTVPIISTQQKNKWSAWLNDVLKADYYSNATATARESNTSGGIEDTFGVTLIDFPTARGDPPPPPLQIPADLNELTAPSKPSAPAEEATLSPNNTILRFPAFPLLTQPMTEPPVPTTKDDRPTEDYQKTRIVSRDGAVWGEENRQSPPEPSTNAAQKRQLAMESFEEAFAHLQQGDLVALASAYERASSNGHHGAAELSQWLHESFPNWQTIESLESEILEAVTMVHGQFLFDDARKSERGIGRRQDLLRALKQYRQAAELNHPEALTRLGMMHLHGRGVQNDPVIAASFLIRASEHKHGPAFLQLGRLYEKGLGIQRNWAKAKACYEKALSLGEDDAADKLESLKNRKSASAAVPPVRPSEEDASPRPNKADPGQNKHDARHIFVSYCRKDAQTVHAIVELLRKRGFTLWIDVADADGSGGIPAADSWPEEIVRQIRASCLFVCMVSGHSVRSPHVKNEVYLARRYKLSVVPAFIEELAPEELPDFFQYYFASIQYLPLYKHPLEAQALRLGRAIDLVLSSTKDN